jgi:predicted  nucleic acid-binding Zn-ribbon protein
MGTAGIPPLKVSGILIQEDRWATMQREHDELRAEIEHLELALYEIERMPFGFEAEVHAIAAQALDRAEQAQQQQDDQDRDDQPEPAVDIHAAD